MVMHLISKGIVSISCLFSKSHESLCLICSSRDIFSTGKAETQRVEMNALNYQLLELGSSNFIHFLEVEVGPTENRCPIQYCMTI